MILTLAAFLSNSFESQFPPPSLHSKSGNSAMKLSEDTLHYFEIKYFVLEYSIYAVPSVHLGIIAIFLLWLLFPGMQLLSTRDATEIIAVRLSRSHQHT